MGNRYFITFLFLIFFVTDLRGQEFTYTDYDLRPDIWYNGQDGVRLGGVVKFKQVQDILNDHEVVAGFWYHTNNDLQRVSYYTSYSKKLWFLTDVTSFASLDLESFSRAGLIRHQGSIYKRYVDDFNELRFQSFRLGFRSEDFFGEDYLINPDMWRRGFSHISFVEYRLNRVYDKSALSMKTWVGHNTYEKGAARAFTRGTTEVNYDFNINSNFGLKSRLFVGLGSEGIPPQYSFMAANASPVEWLNNPFFRARDTLPLDENDNGLLQVAGGPNLRGYSELDFSQLLNRNTFTYSSAGAVNLEFHFDNPIDRSLNNLKYVGDLVTFHSYSFFDAGSLNGIEEDVIADAGLGFSLDINIPNYLGERRGFVLRYEIPFWLSFPQPGDNEFKFRQLIGFGGVIEL